MLWLILSLAFFGLLALVVVVLYNRLVRLRNRAENSWAQVDVQLRRRYDLVPNLVEAVKGYAAHERRGRGVQLRAADVLRDRGTGPGGPTSRVLIVALAALAVAGPAQAKSFSLPEADIAVFVESDGTV